MHYFKPHWTERGNYRGVCCDFLWKIVKTSSRNVNTAITALVSKLTNEMTVKINQIKCDAKPKASYLTLSWAHCFCVQAAFLLPAQKRARTEGRRGGRERSGRGVCRTRVCTTHVKMTVCARVFCSVWASNYLKFPFLLHPSKNKTTSRANEEVFLWKRGTQE